MGSIRGTQTQRHPLAGWVIFCCVGRGGFEPPKANADGFTARSLWPLGHRPNGAQPYWPVSPAPYLFWALFQGRRCSAAAEPSNHEPCPSELVRFESAELGLAAQFF